MANFRQASSDSTLFWIFLLQPIISHMGTESPADRFPYDTGMCPLCIVSKKAIHENDIIHNSVCILQYTVLCYPKTLCIVSKKAIYLKMKLFIILYAYCSILCYPKNTLRTSWLVFFHRIAHHTIHSMHKDWYSYNAHDNNWVCECVVKGISGMILPGPDGRYLALLSIF